VTETLNKIELSTSVQYLKGVGPARAVALGELGVRTAEDLLNYFGRDWSFVPEVIPIARIRPNQTACVIGQVERTDWQPYRRKPFFEVMLADVTGLCRVIWFNGKYLVGQLEPGKILLVYGKAAQYKHQLQFTNPKFHIVPPEQSRDGEAFSGPVYPASAEIASWQIKRIIKTSLDKLCALVPELFDKALLKKNDLIERAKAYEWIHNPTDEKQLDRAKRRLKYDELFLMQLGLALKRHHLRHTAPATPLPCSDKIDSHIRRRFPFLLTEDQDKVIAEIVADLAKSIPMNRLLQGDVGSGKTVVALYAALVAVANKQQVAIMAPTEILARQHYESVERYLKNSKVRRMLLVGGMPALQRSALVRQIQNGKADIVVGTVALIQEDVDFANLGLVIIDEQHKFGVHQRAMLRKGKSPHCLVMTATPIPRTLTMTAFGDLDVSTIRHSPPGRGEVITRQVHAKNRDAALDFIRKQLRAGRQAYFVYPRIDAETSSESANGDVKAATDEHRTLSRVFPEYNVALLHGQMKTRQKEQTMADFRAGKIQAMVSTVVIEVGIDVPNATIMVIENAERFGLAQLHQLRGRIGRGANKSYCFLFSQSDDETAMARLDIMTRSNDGFEIAEQDLRLRGPGELFSTRQHGLGDLKIANIIDDFDLLNLARRDAFEMIQNDPSLNDPQNAALRKTLIDKFGASLGLVDVG
jgi:ATP-dependent DNA helicase RecG